jgi:hypothetical protein
MSLETCPNCGNAISAQADRCPQCGRPTGGGDAASEGGSANAQRGGKLYKTVRVAGVLLFCGSVASCSSILFAGTKNMNHVLGMNLAFFGLVLGILLTMCPRAFSTR